MKSHSYLANICILKRTYDYKNIYVKIGLWADIEFKPKILVLEDDNEVVSISENEFYYCNKLNSSDLYDYLYCNKFCDIHIIPKLIETLSLYSNCLYLYLKYLCSLNNDIINCITKIKYIIKQYALFSHKVIHEVLMNNCDENSLIENEMLTIGLDYFMFDMILKL